MESERYRDLIELMYIFLSLGYRGRYALEMHGEKKYNVILKDLTAYMRKNYPKIELTLTEPEKHIVNRNLSMRIDIPAWLIFLFSFIALFFVFIIFDNTLSEFVEKTLVEIKAFHVETE